MASVAQFSDRKVSKRNFLRSNGPTTAQPSILHAGVRAPSCRPGACRRRVKTGSGALCVNRGLCRALTMGGLGAPGSSDRDASEYSPARSSAGGRSTTRSRTVRQSPFYRRSTAEILAVAGVVTVRPVGGVTVRDTPIARTVSDPQTTPDRSSGSSGKVLGRGGHPLRPDQEA